ncbi:hypothetical protein MCEMHM16_00842 [Candidatus Methylopumilus planktonicus]
MILHPLILDRTSLIIQYEVDVIFELNIYYVEAFQIYQ